MQIGGAGWGQEGAGSRAGGSGALVFEVVKRCGWLEGTVAQQQEWAQRQSTARFKVVNFIQCVFYRS